MNGKPEQIRTLSGETVPLENLDTEELKRAVNGNLLGPGTTGYDDACAIWNGMIESRPALVVRCRGTADVVEAIRFARSRNVLTSIRSGGHNVAGNALCDGGLTIDLSRLRGIHVNPRERTALVQPGCTLGDFDREAQLFALASPTGIVSNTGLTGLTLGGGFGWLSRKHGFTCDNLLSAEVVTAAGDVITTSETEHPDLFWGMRGAGGNFGVVTSLKYRLHPVGPTLLAGLLLHKIAAAAELLRFWRDFVADSPKELGSLAVFRLAPPAPFVPEALHGEPVVGIILLYAGDIKEGQRVVQPLREFGDPIADLVGPTRYTTFQSALDEGQPSGAEYYWKSEYLSELENSAIDTVASHARRLTSPLSRILVMQLGGAIQEVDEMAMAASHRNANFVLAINGGWSDPSESDRHIAWTKETHAALQSFSSGGSYVNFLTSDESEERIRAAYGEAKLKRLSRLKREYDPNNFFRVNQNIRPLS